MQRLCSGFLIVGLCTLCVLAALFVCLPAQAQQATSTDEEVGMAFFKIAGANPDYTKLAKGSRAYRLTPLARRETFLAAEKQRLIKQFNSYDETTQLLRVRTVALVDLAATPQEKADPVYTMTISFRQGDIQFFPYQYQDYKIAVIPQRLNEQLHQTIPEEQFVAMKTAFGDTLQGKANLFVELKPVKSYIDQPYKIGGTEQWALITNVAGLTLNTLSGAPLWNYSAPWYISPVTDDLRDMYSTKIEQKQQEQGLENPLQPAR